MKAFKYILTILCTVCLTIGSLGDLSLILAGEVSPVRYRSINYETADPVTDALAEQSAAENSAPTQLPGENVPDPLAVYEDAAALPGAEQEAESFTDASEAVYQEPVPEYTETQDYYEQGTEESGETVLEKELAASDGNTYLVTVSYKPDSGIPANAQLQVKEVINTDLLSDEAKAELEEKPEEEKTEEEKREEELNANYSEYIERSAKLLKKKADDLKFALAFDITLQDPATKEEYQPTGDVKVTIRLADVEMEEEAKIDVIHFDTEKGEAELKKALEKEKKAKTARTKAAARKAVEDATVLAEIGKPEILKSETTADTVEFDTAGFSVYVVVTETKEQTLTTSDGYTYNITASYDYTAGIPKGALLVAEEIYSWSEEYSVYLAQSAEKLGTAAENLVYAKPIDIYFLDPETGAHIKPGKNVKITIELWDADLSAGENVDVVHFGEEVEVVSASLEGNNVSFEAGEFSVYVVVFTAEVEGGDEPSEPHHYDYYLFDIDNILLSELINQLAITEFVISDVTGVVSSSEELQAAPVSEDPEQPPTDWSIQVAESFEQGTLTLTLSNENTVTITVKKETAHNAKVSITENVYDPESKTITYTAVVEAEGTLDYNEEEYPVMINLSDPSLFVGGSYTYEHSEGFVLPAGASESVVRFSEEPSGDSGSEGGNPEEPTGDPENGDVNSDEPGQDSGSEDSGSGGLSGDLTGAAVTVAHMYDGDTLTLIYTLKAEPAEYIGEGRARVNYTVSLTNSDNPLNDPADDTAYVTTGFEYKLVNKSCTNLDGSWATWKIEVNPDGLTLNDNNLLILKDSFNFDDNTYGKQSIDYSSIVTDPAESITYDYSGDTGTFMIPDSTKVTIIYRARVKAHPGEAKDFGGPFLLQKEADNATITIEEGSEYKSGVIYPSASDAAATTGEYFVKMFVYAAGQMQTGISGAQFILLDANQRTMVYNNDINDPVTFTTGDNGYVDIKPLKERGVSLEKNTAYYLEMIKVPEGYNKDNTLYSFMITDDPEYNSGGIWTYYNGDTMKVRLYPETAGLNVSVRFSGNYSLRDDQKNDIRVVLQKQNGEAWDEVEGHTLDEFQYGSLTFETDFVAGETYRVIEENLRPWDLDESINLNTSYYLVIGDAAAEPPVTEPIPFDVTDENVNHSFSAVMNNEYEEHKLTLTKMDKLTGDILSGAKFEVKKAVGDDDPVATYITDATGVIEITGGGNFESEVLYYVEETEAPEGYLLPITPKRFYFYFCNDPYLEPEILRNLPDGETAVNLSESYDSISLDNQEEKASIPVMATWQDGTWPGTEESPIRVTIGLYQFVEGDEQATPVLDDNDQPRTVTLTKQSAYNNTAFTNLPVRTDDNKPITYSILEERITQGDDYDNNLLSKYVQEYGISDSGVYIVRNRKAATLTIEKEWYSNGEKVEDSTILAQQSDVIFDVYRSTEKISDPTPEDGITNADMAAFVGGLTKVRSNLTFGNNDSWTMNISDLVEKEDVTDKPYHYYVFENVPSFGDETYEIVYATETDNEVIKIQNPVAPARVGLTVAKDELKDDPREETKDTDFEFTLLLKKGDHVIRNYTVYEDTEHPENSLMTDWNGEVKFTLKPERNIVLSLPAGVTATITETLNREYHENAASEDVEDLETEEGNIFRYNTDTAVQEVTVTYTNTLHVFCKVVDINGDEHPFESLKSALGYIHDNEAATRIHGDGDDFAKIEMIEDYEMPAKDVFELEANEKIILTTAKTETEDPDCTFPFKTKRTTDTDKAIITRVEDGGSLLTNAGELTLEKVILDGGCAADAEEGITIEGDGGIVYNTGTLNLNAGTVLRNSSVSGKGGAIYSSGTIHMKDGTVISGNSAKSGSAIYLEDGALNMTGGEIHENKVEDDGAVAVENLEVKINLSGNVKIHSNTDTDEKAANLYIGADSDRIINVVGNGLDSDAEIWVKPMQGHREIGEQFATAEHGAADNNTECFVNDLYEYRGKLKDGTATNIVWNGLDLILKKVVPPGGANPSDRFKITLSSMSIRKNNYLIDGTIDYEVTQAGLNPGTIVLNNVEADAVFTIHQLPVGSYTLSETVSNYEPGYSGKNDETARDIVFNNGSFTLNGNSTVTITNTRKTADINLTKTLQDRLVGDAAVPFDFEITLKDPNGTAIKNFTLADGITTDASGKANLSMSPTNASAAIKNVKAPVGTIMTIKETTPDYRITFDAKTPAGDEAGETIPDSAEAEDTFEFEVPEDGANIGISNVRKMAHIQLTNNLVNKVSTDEAFDLTVILKNHDGSAAANYVLYEDAEHPENSIITNGDGIAILPCTFPRDVTARGFALEIPEGTHLTVTEAEKVGTGTNLLNYDISYAVNGLSKENIDIRSVMENDESIVITNTRKPRTITVSNTVNGYSGNVQAFRFTATVEDQAGEKDYDSNGFTDGVMTFDLTNGQSQTLTVPYNASLNIKEQYVIGYETVIKRGSSPDSDVDTEIEFTVENNDTVAFTNNQLISIVLVNQTSSTLENVQVYTAYGTKMYRVNDAGDGQDEVTVTNHWATVSIGAGKTAILEVEHNTSGEEAVKFEQAYTVKGYGPAEGYYYTIQNEPSFHEFADPAFLRIYDTAAFEVKGKLRYSVADSKVTITEQPLVSFDANGGVWTTEMEGYRDRDGDRQVYQFAAEKGEAVSAPQPDPVYPTAEGITFLGWTADETYAKADHSDGQVDSSKLHDFSTPVNDPVNLYAIWSKGDTRTVTVDNAIAGSLTITATLSNTTPIEGIVLADGAVTDQNGTATFTLDSGEKKNLTIPDGAKLVLKATESCMEYSSVYSDADSMAQSFTINSVDRDGTVSFIAGICKITDSAGNILYDNTGKPAVYRTLADAFTAYNGTLYTDASHTTAAEQAAVKMLIDEYGISSKHAFPTKNVIVTTAGKTDTHFPYVGVRESATLYRAVSYTSDCLFTLENAGREVTLTNIILDGHNVPAAKTILGSFIYVNHANAVLNVTTGAVFRNVVFAAYDNKDKARGGAIYINNGILNVNAGLFSNLKARRGGAIHAEGNAVLNITGANGSTRFENCTTDSSNADNAGGDGGAIYYSSARDLTINGGIDEYNPGIIFTECRSGSNWGDGGAILADTGYNYAVSVSGCAFIECSARNNSGGNTDGTGGGAINGFHVKKLKVSYCTFEACDSLRAAGAVECYVKTTEVEDNETIFLTYCTFTDCNSKGQGGAVAVYQDNNSATNSRTELIVDGCSFVNCSSGTVNGSGGAIQSYLPCMQFEYSSFTDCWAGKEGGAFNNWYGGDNAKWPNSYMNVIGCTFIRCRAEDRYEIGQVYHYGGGIATKANTLLIDDSYFEDCVSTLQGGGAVYCSAHDDTSRATVTNSTFKNCQSKLNGGALAISNNTMIVENSNFYGCNSFAGDAGALYHGNGLNSRTQAETTIKNCTFSADPEDNSTASCSAAGNGGAVWTRAQNVEITDCTINGCEAVGKGGGIYLSKNSSLSAVISGGIISGCQATNGSAVFQEGNTTYSFIKEDDSEQKFERLTITGNNATDANGGAIARSGDNMYFEGNVYIKDNTCNADSVDHNVVLANDSNTIINTTNKGLDGSSEIGVYVTDAANVFSKHGSEGQPFGTWAKVNDALDCFINDRVEGLNGYQSAENDNKIYWGFYICKITDAIGNTLKRPSGKDAVYQRLTMAIDDFTKVKDDNNETGKAVYIKMLEETYEIKQTGQIENFPDANVNITLTTASKTEPDSKYPYRGTEGTVCTISRTNSTNQLFKLGNAKVTFRLENITLDGRRNKTADTGEYRLIEVSAGKLVVSDGTTMQYGRSTHGGAVYAKGSTATVEVEGAAANPARFIKCTASTKGGAIYVESCSFAVNGTKSGDRYDVIFENCEHNGTGGTDGGGAIHHNKCNAPVTGASFINCRAMGRGGAIQTDNNNTDYAMTVASCFFSNCYGKVSGGAINSRTKPMTVSDSVFEGCLSGAEGGAINHDHNGSNQITLTDVVCRNCGTDPVSTQGTQWRNGGAIRSNALNATVTDGSFINCKSYGNGGALYLDRDANGTKTIIGTTFQNCQAENGSGGAIWFTTGTMTITDATIDNCIAKEYSGAVYGNKDNATTVLNISGRTKISHCYAKQGGAIYLKNKTTMNLTDPNGRTEFSNNGYATIDGTKYDAVSGACIYLAEGSKLNISGSPVFKRNILPYPEEDRIINGGESDYKRQDIYLAGYKNTTYAASINIADEITARTGDDMIWVWPEQSPHIIAGDQFATTKNGISEATLNRFRNALSDTATECSDGEYLAGVRLNNNMTNAYWSKMYSISFRKIDDKAVGVPDAGFTLYKNPACTSSDVFAEAYSTGQGADKGKVLFTSIPIGAYYLKETDLPDSFGREEGIETYLVLVGTPMLSSDNEFGQAIWHGGGPLDGVPNAQTLVTSNTTDAGKYYGIYPINKTTGKADVSINRASGNSGVKNIRIDFEAYFMKVDGNGAALPNAEFTIFSQQTDDETGDPKSYENGYPMLELWSRDGENYPEPVKSADGTANYKDRSGEILPKGLVYFPELPIGTYYLLETAYPIRNGSNRRTFYVETDRLLQLVISKVEGGTEFELKEWTEETDPETGEHYKEVEKEDGAFYGRSCYQIANEEAVCKLTDNAGNLLYTLGHDGSTTLPAVYPTLEEGFDAAGTGKLVDKNGGTVVDETTSTNVPLKLQVLKDFVISNPITYNNNIRPLTFTTASKTETGADKFIFVTNRTSDNARAEIKRNYSDDNGAMLSIIGADLTLQNINLNGQKTSFNGRAIHVKAGTLNISNNTQIQNFKQQVSDENTDENDVSGGAILLEDGTTLRVDGGPNRTAVFANNEVINNRDEGFVGADGGAIAIGNNCTVSLMYAQFNSNKATAKEDGKGNGGAISMSDPESEEAQSLQLKSVVFQGNTASSQGGAISTAEKVSLIVENSIFRNNNSAPLGGAIFLAAGANATLANNTIQNNTASQNGGAIFLSTGANATLASNTIQNNTASQNGGAIFLANGMDNSSESGSEGGSEGDPEENPEGGSEGAGAALTTLTLTSGRITGNNAVSGGGGIAVGGSNVRLNFSGSPVVTGNKRNGIDECNVELSVDSNQVINTSGLSEGASIGIYVPDKALEDTTLYDVHGVRGMPFGTYTEEGLNADLFINDRDSKLYGYAGKDNLLYWVFPICKITDENGSLLFINGKPAVYDMNIPGVDSENPGEKAGYPLSRAFTDYGSASFTFEDGTPAVPAYLKMLVESYDIRQTDSFTVPEGKSLTLTTASSTDNKGTNRHTYPGPFTGNVETVCTLNRGANTDNSMIIVNNNDTAFGVENITLDGGADIGKSVTVDGGIIRVEAGSLKVGTGATLQNSETTGSGGAVYLADKTRLTMTGGTIKNNKAKIGGGICVTTNSDNTNSRDRDSKERTVKISNALFSGNIATTCGGGLLIGQGTVAELNNTRMIDNEAQCTATSDYFTNTFMDWGRDYSYGCGGAIYADRKTTIYINNCSIGEEGHPNKAYSEVYSSGLNETIGGTGGGIFLFATKNWEDWAAAKVYMESTNVQYNEALYGGGIGTHNNCYLSIENSNITNNTASQRGGGIHSRTESGAFTILMTNGNIKNNTASNKGGGFYIDSSDASKVVFDSVNISENEAKYGGGGYANKLTLKNTQITGNLTTLADNEGPLIDGAGGLYLVDIGQLVISDNGSKLPTNIKDNKTKSSRTVPSDLRLPYNTSTKVNNAESIILTSPFKGKIYVTNPGRVGTDFGKASEDSDNAYKDYPDAAYWESANIVSENDSMLYGRRKGTILYWYQDYICQLTTGIEDGDLLYLDDGNGNKIEAAYMYLYDKDNTVESAIGTLNNNCQLYQRTGEDTYTAYNGSSIFVEMLVDYGINTPVKADISADKLITLTTALPRGDTRLNSKYKHGYRVSGKKTAMLYPGSSMGVLNRNNQEAFMFRLLQGTKFTLLNITLDGGVDYIEDGSGHVLMENGVPKYEEDSFISKKDGFLVQITNNSTLCLGANATLQNAFTTHMYGGAAVCFGQGGSNRNMIMLPGSRIYRCFAAYKPGVTRSENMQDDYGGYGGAISFIRIGGNDTLTIKGGTIEQCWAQEKGGAIYLANNASKLIIDVENGSTFTMKDCLAPKGGGIYLDDRGTGGDFNPWISSTVKMEGRLSFSGNYGTGYSNSYSGKTNGGEDILNGDKGIRQDIFVQGFECDYNKNPIIPPKNITLTGAISAEPGTVFVWVEPTAPVKADTPSESDPTHHKSGDQFAVLADTYSPDEAVLKEMLKVFRNARDDEITENPTESYLTGTTGDDINSVTCVYWSGIEGSRKVILRKVNGSFEPLTDAVFTVTKTQEENAAPVSVKLENGDTDTLQNLKSQSSGVIWIGTLPYGKYYLHETAYSDGITADEWFILTVSEEGVGYEEVNNNKKTYSNELYAQN